MAQYYLRMRGKIMGPFDLDRLQTLRQRGRLSRTHEISTDRKSWQPAGNFAKLFPDGDGGGSSESVYRFNQGGAAATVAPVAVAPAVTAGSPSDAAAVWYYERNGEQQGPVSLAVLGEMVMAGKLTADDMVWKNDFDDWKPAGEIKELFPSIGGASADAVRTAAVRTYGAYREVSSSRFWDSILNHIRREYTAAFLEATTRGLIQCGGHALSVAMLVGPGLIIYFAIKEDSVRGVGLGVVVFLGAAILKYIAQRMCGAAHNLVQASPSRLSSTAFLDSLALLILLIGMGATAELCVLAIQNELPALFVTAVNVMIVFGLTGCMALQPGWLNIDCSGRATAGEEGIGVLSFILKIGLRFVAINFGVGAITGTGGLLVATLMIVAGGEWLFKGLDLALQSAVVLALTVVLPLLFYVINSLLFIPLDMAQSVISIPSGFERLASQAEKTDNDL